MRTLTPLPGGNNNLTLGALLDQVAAYRALGAVVLFLVAKSRGLPGAIMCFGVDEAEVVLTRFCTTGVPSCWHAGCELSLTLHALDPADEEGHAEVAAIATKRWFWATAPGSRVDLIDPQTAPRADTAAVVAGARPAARRRGEADS